MSDEERRQALEAASLESANTGIKGLLLLNGGAAVALLAFLANTYSADLDTDRARFFDAATRSLVWFATGAGLSVVTSILAYATNQTYASALLEGVDRARLWRSATIWNRIAIATAFASLFAFFYGVYRIWSSL